MSVEIKICWARITKMMNSNKPFSDMHYSSLIWWHLNVSALYLYEHPGISSLSLTRMQFIGQPYTCVSLKHSKDCPKHQYLALCTSNFIFRHLSMIVLSTYIENVWSCYVNSKKCWSFTHMEVIAEVLRLTLTLP